MFYNIYSSNDLIIINTIIDKCERPGTSNVEVKLTTRESNKKIVLSNHNQCMQADGTG
jgi:hypothetical protein